jgi:hypothetical protein
MINRSFGIRSCRSLELSFPTVHTETHVLKSCVTGSRSQGYCEAQPSVQTGTKFLNIFTKLKHLASNLTGKDADLSFATFSVHQMLLG